MAIQKRNIAVAVILSIVTCGIYGIIWYYWIAQDMGNHNTPNRVDMSPGLIILLNIVTCGIYGMYVYYKWGKQTPEVFYGYGRQGEDRSVLYLVLAIFELSIINMCLIQSDLNSLADGTAPYGGNYQAPPPPPAGYQQAPPPPTAGYQQAPPPATGYQAPTPPPPPPGSPYDTSGQNSQGNP